MSYSIKGLTCLQSWFADLALLVEAALLKYVRFGEICVRIKGYNILFRLLVMISTLSERLEYYLDGLDEVKMPR